MTRPPTPPTPDGDDLSPAEREQARLLDRYLARGPGRLRVLGERRTAGLDPDLAATARRVHDAIGGSPPRLAAHDRRRIWADLMAEPAGSVPSAPPRPDLTAPSGPLRPAPPTELPTRRQRWVTLSRLVAALTLLVLATAVVLGIVRSGIGDEDAAPTSLPALVAPTTFAVADGGQVEPDVDEPTPTPVPSLPATARFDPDRDGIYSFDELRQAVTEMLPAYTFPTGYTVTVDTLLADDQAQRERAARDQVEAQYISVYAYTVVGVPFECAWGQSWLAAFNEGDEPAMTSSLAQLRWENERNGSDDPLRQLRPELYDLAETGDPAGLRSRTQDACDAAQGAFASMPASDDPAPVSRVTATEQVPTRRDGPAGVPALVDR